MSAQEVLLGCSLCMVFVRESGTFVFMVQLKVRDSSPHSVSSQATARVNRLEKNSNEVRHVLLNFQKEGEKGGSTNRLSTVWGHRLSGFRSVCPMTSSKSLILPGLSLLICKQG